MEQTSQNDNSSSLKKLNDLTFDNTALRQLPLDPELKNYVRRNVKNASFSRVQPTPVKNPRLVTFSPEALQLLDLDPSEANTQEFVEFVAGNQVLSGSEPAAHCYCGHQFGNFAGQLGDGRAMYLGETVNHKGERWELQLKGAGKTPYSRDADGRAVLRSSIREFLCSEAMAHLGVPTTRAGALITSDSLAIRDIHYDGHPIQERCSIVLRIAPTFIRFGSFQIALSTDPMTGRSGPSPGNFKIIKRILDYVIINHYSHILKRFSADHNTVDPSILDGENAEKVYIAFFEEVVDRTAYTVALWQCVGFAHGVLNTDNLSILGLTIDYGPFGFIENYDPNHICNSSDTEGRYSFKNQPSICKWNLNKLAEALSPLMSDLDILKDVVASRYDKHYESIFYSQMYKKLGLIRKKYDEDKELIDSLLQTMSETGCDMTNTFRNLKRVSIVSDPTDENLKDSQRNLLYYLLNQCCGADVIRRRLRPSIHPGQLQMLMTLAAENPEILEALGKSKEFIEEQMAKITKYNELRDWTDRDKATQDNQKWSAWIAKYTQRLFREAEDLKDPSQLEELNRERVSVMDQNNPKFILRNHLAQRAIEAAEKGNYDEVNSLYKVLQSPFDEHPELASKEYDQLNYAESAACSVSCSS